MSTLLESFPFQYTIILPGAPVTFPIDIYGTGTSDSPGVVSFFTEDHSLNVLSLYCHLN